jgi:hypothetical protein
MRNAMTPGPSARSRLLRHDWTVARNVLFHAPSTWRERVRWLVGMPVLLVALHFWLTELPVEIAARTISGSSFLYAATVTRFAGRRLEFHRTEGVRATDALRPAIGWQYLAAVVGLGVVVATIFLALLDPRVVAAGFAAMAAGVLAGSLINFAMRFTVPRRAISQTWRAVSAWLRRPEGGLAIAPFFALLALAIARWVPAPSATGMLGPATLACGFALTTINSEVVRFMAQCGFPVSQTILVHVRGVAVFAPIAMGIAYLGFGASAIVVVGAALAITLSVLCLRVLTYRLYAKHAADLIASMLIASLAMIAVYIPGGAPLIIAAVIGALWLRARPATWLITA